jgi:hypothetical protein
MAIKYTARLEAKTTEGDAALLRSLRSEASGIVKTGLTKSGIAYRKILLQNKTPVIVEWEFILTGLAERAFKGKKNSFVYWTESMDERFEIFDKAEGTKIGKDYAVLWRQE